MGDLEAYVMVASESAIDLGAIAGLPIVLHAERLTIGFGDGIVTDPPSQRRVEDIRAMLFEPDSTGPDPLYTIYMNVRPPALVQGLREHGLGFGVVVDAGGQIGREHVRSQGHTHSTPPGSDLAYSEVYEIWSGQGTVFLQDRADGAVNEVVLINVEPGNKVIIPPGWVHVMINRGSAPLVFGAIYALDAELIYGPLRELGGTAWYVLADGSLAPNPRYTAPPAPRRMNAREYPAFGATSSRPMLDLVADQPGIYDYVARPQQAPHVWDVILGDLR
jgi:glucose-6-phosphate isomerase